MQTTSYIHSPLKELLKQSSEVGIYCYLTCQLCFELQNFGGIYFLLRKQEQSVSRLSLKVFSRTNTVL